MVCHSGASEISSPAGFSSEIGASSSSIGRTGVGIGVFRDFAAYLADLEHGPVAIAGNQQPLAAGERQAFDVAAPVGRAPEFDLAVLGQVRRRIADQIG